VAGIGGSIGCDSNIGALESPWARMQRACYFRRRGSQCAASIV